MFLSHYLIRPTVYFEWWKGLTILKLHCLEFHINYENKGKSVRFYKKHNKYINELTFMA